MIIDSIAKLILIYAIATEVVSSWLFTSAIWRETLVGKRRHAFALYIIMGRWRGLKREERKCTECDIEEVEDVKHFLMRCKARNGDRVEQIEKMKKVVTGFD